MAVDNYWTDLLTLAKLALMVFDFFVTLKFPFLTPFPCKWTHTFFVCLWRERRCIFVKMGRWKGVTWGVFRKQVRSEQRVVCYVHDFERSHLGSQPAVITKWIFFDCRLFIWLLSVELIKSKLYFKHKSSETHLFSTNAAQVTFSSGWTDLHVEVLALEVSGRC